MFVSPSHLGPIPCASLDCMRVLPFLESQLQGSGRGESGWLAVGWGSGRVMTDKCSKKGAGCCCCCQGLGGKNRRRRGGLGLEVVSVDLQVKLLVNR